MEQTTTQTQLERISNSIRKTIAKSAENKPKRVPTHHAQSLNMKEANETKQDAEIRKLTAGVYANALLTLRIA